MERKWILTACAAILALFGPQFALAEDAQLREVVVSASKFATKAEESTVNIGVVTASDMEDRQINSVTEAISTLPGVGVIQQGGMGQFTGVNIRGARDFDTQFRFDDFPLRDSSDGQNSLRYLLNNFSFSQGALERIEVLKGPSSSLYGTAATGGVVSLFPSKKWGAGFHGDARALFGSHNSIIAGGSLSHGTDSMYLNFNPMHRKSDGFNGQWYDQTSFTATGGARLGEKTTLELSSLGFTSKMLSIWNPTIDANNNLVQPRRLSDDNILRSDMALAGLTLSHDFSSNWQTRLKLSASNSKRDYRGPDYGITGTQYRGNLYFAEWLNTFRATENITLLAGLDTEFSKYSYTDSLNTQAGHKASYNAQALFVRGEMALLDRALILTAGGRYNWHSEYSGRFTWNVGAAYLLKEYGTKFYGQIATGFRTPSLYETYGKSMFFDYTNWPNIVGQLETVGNKNLKPETSMTYEIGVEQKLWDDRVKFGLTYFQTNFKNQIDWVTTNMVTFSGRYENRAKGKIRGVEASLFLQPWDVASLLVAYTRVKSSNQVENGKWEEIRIKPRHEVAATLTLYPIEAVTVSATARWQSSRLYQKKAVEKSFFTADAAVTWRLNENFALLAKVNNITNKKYTQAGYLMPGTTAYVGFEAKF